MQAIRLNHIRNVAMVAEHGSLRAAARALGIAQPVLTRNIQEVERALGAILFERTSKGVTPTAAGEAFLRRALLIQNELVRARDEVAQLAGAAVGSVQVGFSTVPHLALLPRILSAFRARYPDVTLTVMEGLLPRLYPLLEDGTLDFYIGPLLETNLSAELEAALLFDNERVIFARRGHPLAGARSLAELGEASWISTSVTRDSAAEMGPLFEEHGLAPPRVALHASSALTMVLGAANSDLLALLPRQWLDFPGIDELLVRVGIGERIRAPAIYAVSRRRLPLTPAAQYLYDLSYRAALTVRDALIAVPGPAGG